MASDVKWTKDLDKGHKVEASAIKFLKEQYKGNCFLPVPNDLTYQKDGDIAVLKRSDNQYRKLEVKSGVSENKRIIIELEDGAKQGWFYRSNADIILWHDDKLYPDYFVILKFKEFREWIQNKALSYSYLSKLFLVRDEGKISWCKDVDILRIQEELNPPWIKLIKNSLT